LIRNLAVVVALWSLSALAQDSSGFGLDLTDDAQKKESQSKGAEPPPATSSPKAEPEAPAAAPEEPPMTEREITQDDRVKSVQRKVYLKQNRFELTPMITLSLNDPLYVKWGAALRAAYYLADNLAISVRGVYIDVVPTDDVRTAKGNFQSRIFFSRPNWAGMGDVEWSPLYGKVTIFNSILHFDAYILGGLGVVNTSSSSPDSAAPKVAADLGVGLRFMVKDWLAVNVALINTTYVDQPPGTTIGATQNIMTINAGISFFFPFKSTGREAE
jgi:outer membrane beta-barrel protein